jgi:hypothetical protein
MTVRILGRHGEEEPGTPAVSGDGKPETTRVLTVAGLLSKMTADPPVSLTLLTFW